MDYICGYCGKHYPTIGERMECERKCHEQKVQEEERVKASKLDEEMKKDSDEIVNLINERSTLDEKIAELIKNFDKTYGVIAYSKFPARINPFDFLFRI